MGLADALTLTLSRRERGLEFKNISKEMEKSHVSYS
jgi:hypothetical protein